MAQSPITGKRKEFKTKQDILDEIIKLIKQSETEKYGLGQTLYYNLPFFSNPNALLRDWQIEMINDYYLCKNFNVPLGMDLDELSAFRTDCFILIENEFNKIEKLNAKENA
jgi:hypothetical protein